MLLKLVLMILFIGALMSTFDAVFGLFSNDKKNNKKRR